MSLRYLKLQPIQYGDDSVVEGVNIPYRKFIERENGFELEVNCKILNSRARIGGPLHLLLNITNIGGVNIDKFKIDISSYSAEDNSTPYYDRFVLWITETLEVGKSIVKTVVLQNSYKDLDISNNDLSDIITESEKDLRRIEYSIPSCDDPLDLTSKTNIQSKAKIIDAVTNDLYTLHDDAFVSKEKILKKGKDVGIDDEIENEP